MTLPQLVEAPRAGVGAGEWLQDHDLAKSLAEDGAVLLRGFTIDGLVGFRAVAQQLFGPPMAYVEGASPRTALGDGVYTSTEYDRTATVAQHNELSYSHRWPGMLAFYCHVPPAEGGQTPLSDSRAVFSDLAEGPAEQILRAGIRYLRFMPRGRGAGVAWPVVFATEDRAAVSRYCDEARITYTWERDALRTQQTRPAAVLHPRTGDPVWFNQAHQWHPSNAGNDAAALLRDVYGDDLPLDAQLGDGNALPLATLDHIRRVYADRTTMFDWRAGDLLIIDNMLASHGRQPFSGARDIRVAMGNPVRLDEVEVVSAHD